MGIASFWPLLYHPFFIIYVAVFAITASDVDAGIPLYGSLLTIYLATILGMLGLVVYYIVNVFKGGAVPQNRQVLWTLILIFACPLSLPFYWYFYIWKPKQNIVIHTNTVAP